MIANECIDKLEKELEERMRANASKQSTQSEKRIKVCFEMFGLIRPVRACACLCGPHSLPSGSVHAGR